MKITHIAGLILIAIAVGALVSMTSEFSHYETFSTAVGAPDDLFQVKGELVKAEELYYEPSVDPNYFAFYMKDASGEVRKVVFHGEKPQDFERSESIVLTGRTENEMFIATKILMKCPSKYINDELEVTAVSSNKG